MRCPFLYVLGYLVFILLILVWSFWIIFNGMLLGVRFIKADFKDEWPSVKADFKRVLQGKSFL